MVVTCHKLRASAIQVGRDILCLAPKYGHTPAAVESTPVPCPDSGHLLRWAIIRESLISRAGHHSSTRPMVARPVLTHAKVQKGSFRCAQKQNNRYRLSWRTRRVVIADLCAALTEVHVNIRAMTMLDTVDVGTMRMLVDDVETAKNALRDVGAAFVVVPVISIEVPNVPGAFGLIARTLASKDINIDYIYATALQGSDKTLAIFKVGDHEKALDIEFDL